MADEAAEIDFIGARGLGDFGVRDFAVDGDQLGDFEVIDGKEGDIVVVLRGTKEVRNADFSHVVVHGGYDDGIVELVE